MSITTEGMDLPNSRSIICFNTIFPLHFSCVGVCVCVFPEYFVFALLSFILILLSIRTVTYLNWRAVFSLFITTNSNSLSWINWSHHLRYFFFRIHFVLIYSDPLYSQGRSKNLSYIFQCITEYNLLFFAIIFCIVLLLLFILLLLEYLKKIIACSSLLVYLGVKNSFI